MLELLAPFRKAAVATVGSTIFALGTAATDGAVTGAEVVASIGAGIVVGFVAWRVPNQS